MKRALIALAFLVLPAEGAAEAEFWEEFRLCSRYTEWADASLLVETACRF